jgi:hypothetical protein
MQLKEKKTTMERDKRKLESELDKKRQTVGKQAFLQIFQTKQQQKLKSDDDNDDEKEYETSNKEENESAQMKTPQPPPSINLHNEQKMTPEFVNNNNNKISSPTTPTTPTTIQKQVSLETPRRQWDKSNLNHQFIDLESESKTTSITTTQTNSKGLSKITGSSGYALATALTTSSSASPISASSHSQSPPSQNKNNNKTIQNGSETLNRVNLSKAYYSRDEVLKTIEQFTANVEVTTTTTTTTPKNENDETKEEIESPSKPINKEIEGLTNKLAELQNEINRLNLLQQKQQQQPPQIATTTTTAQKETEKDEITKPESFFISIGDNNDNKPTNQLSNHQNQQLNTIKATNHNLLMKAHNDLEVFNKKFTNNGNGDEATVYNIDVDDGEDGGSEESGDSFDLKQRKREMIIQKQLERRQNQELIRQQREEEKMRKAEEMRSREEEQQTRKQVEKMRKETIFQAYKDKKKQLEEESQTGSFGPPPSNNSNLLNTKRFNSTQRLKATKASNQNLNNNFDNNQFDTGSVCSDRSSLVQQQNGVKSKFCFVFSYFYFNVCISFLLLLYFHVFIDSLHLFCSAF